MGRIFDAVTFGPARRRRSMNKQLARLDAAYRLGEPRSPRDWQPRDQFPGASGSASVGRLVVVLVLLGAAVVGVIVLLRTSANVGAGAGAPPVQPSAGRSASPAPRPNNGTSLPPPGVEEAPNRLRPAVAGPSGSGGYAFAGPPTPDGSPVTYDP